jgi:exonuclease III
MKFFYLLLLFLGLALSGLSQTHDTLNVLVYNIMNYRLSTSSCTIETQQEAGINKIVKYTNPDVIAFNELGNSSFNINFLLNNALNVGGETRYKSTVYAANSNLMNHLFYNQDKLEFYAHDEIRRALDNSNLVRLIDVYTLYVKEPNAIQFSDTTFLTFFVAHLKAGNQNADRIDRSKAASAIMDYLSKNTQIKNYFLCGDLNIYNASESAFQTLVNYFEPSVRFYDPANSIGEWSNNPDYAYIHTQSTRTNDDSDNGCFIGGGSDDRFDYILASEAILTNTNFVDYVDSSYTVIGQDGNRLNQGVKVPANTSAPTEIIDAIYTTSDHYPVMAKFKVDFRNAVGTQTQTAPKENILKLQNPITNKQLNAWWEGNSNQSMDIFDVSGRKVASFEVQNGFNQVDLSVFLNSGMYFICYQHEGIYQAHKIMFH